MSVSTDYNWTVITNEIERNDASQKQLEELEDECSKASSLFDKSEPTEPRNRKFIIFQETKPTSVYSYSIVAGQFKY